MKTRELSYIYMQSASTSQQRHFYEANMDTIEMSSQDILCIVFWSLLLVSIGKVFLCISELIYSQMKFVNIYVNSCHNMEHRGRI